MLLLAACAGPSAVGRWQVENNPNAGLEIREGGQFQGELGAAGNPRIRLEGTWAANGSGVTFQVGGALAQAVPNLTLTGRIEGDVMTLTPPPNTMGLAGTITLRRQKGR